MTRRTLLWVCFAVAAVALAVPATVSFAAAPATAAKTCPSGYVHANLSWGEKCLHEGEYCKVGNVEYHAYGFDCPSDGRLADYSQSAGAATTTTTAAPPAATTTAAPPAPAATAAPPITVLKPVGRAKPLPRTGQKAVALVRVNHDTALEAAPYQQELGWVAQWRGDRWWVVGVFESQWGQRFVVDAGISRGQVETYISYFGRPTAAWIRANTRRWGLSTLYTRYSPSAAIDAVRRSLSLNQYTVKDAAAKLARDSARSVGWYFVFYVQTADGRNLVLPVTGLSGNPAEEGAYTGGYGFGSQPQLQQTVPLNLSDWVRSVAKARGWQPANL